jgi:very-short-patch-repair endonuclease
MRRKIIPYDKKLKEYARRLRNKCTKSEAILWKSLKGKQLLGYDFHRQKPIDRFIADFYCYELKLVIELDGASHHSFVVQRKDRWRTRILEDLGLVVLRFANEEVYSDIDSVIGRIVEYAKDFEARGEIG